MYDIVDRHRERLCAAEDALRAELRAAELALEERRTEAFAKFNLELVESEQEMELRLEQRMREFRGLGREAADVTSASEPSASSASPASEPTVPQDLKVKIVHVASAELESPDAIAAE